MSSKNEHIDIELLRRYYNNELSDSARNALEKQALEDPFLKDAMDGFDENPGSFNIYYEKNKHKFRGKKSYTMVIALSILAALFLVTSLLKLNLNPPQEQLSEQNSDTIGNSTIIQPNDQLTLTSGEEYEMVPPSIDTLEYIAETEMVTLSEVVDHQEYVNETIQEQENTIVVDDDHSIQPELTIEPESAHWHRFGQITTATTYLHELTVVDYREISRNNEKITYKRFELGGVSADQEGAESTEDDLIEREVEIPYFEYLSKSMSFFAAGNYKKALNRYLLILEQYPKDLNALFYGGLSYHNLGQYEQAIVFFNTIINGEIYVFSEEALWYKAKALIKLKKNQEAKSILEEIIAHAGFYSKQAIALRAKL